MSISPQELRWRKAAASTAQGNCVELASVPDGGVAIRDSKDPEGAVLRLTGDGLAALLDCARSGELTALL